MTKRYARILCLLPLLAGGTGFLFALEIHAAEAPELAVQSVDPYQIFFSIGMSELRKQNYPSAIKIFKALSEKVPSQRVRLELARAYFLDRQYRQAKKIFESVLEDPALPWGVRENVNRYLDLIDEALGGFKFSVAFISDTNPLNYTDHRQINIAGQTLTLVPPSENKEVYGVQYTLNATKDFSGDASLVGFLNTSFRDFEGGKLDKWVIDAGLAMAPRSYRKFQGKLGLEESFLGGEQLYRQPYASVTYFPDPVEQFRFSTELKVAHLDVEGFDYLDAYTQTIDLRASRVLRNGTQVLSNLYVENAVTDEDPYSYRGAGLGLTVSFPINRSWGMNASGAIGKRVYLDTDPIFVERRKDLTKKLNLTFYNRQWKRFGLTPEFGISYEQNDSTIEYYEYDKVTFILRATE